MSSDPGGIKNTHKPFFEIMSGSRPKDSFSNIVATSTRDHHLSEKQKNLAAKADLNGDREVSLGEATRVYMQAKNIKPTNADDPLNINPALTKEQLIEIDKKYGNNDGVVTPNEIMDAALSTRSEPKEKKPEGVNEMGFTKSEMKVLKDMDKNHDGTVTAREAHDYIGEKKDKIEEKYRQWNLRPGLGSVALNNDTYRQLQQDEYAIYASYKNNAPTRDYLAQKGEEAKKMELNKGTWSKIISTEEFNQINATQKARK